MKRKRRFRPHRTSEAGLERWLITYADLITLLMIFFVVLYAMSKIDAAKYESLSKALQLEFRNGTTFVPKGTGVMGDAIPGEGKDGKYDQEPKPGEDEANRDAAQQEQDLQNLLQVVRQYIGEHHLEQQVRASDTPRGIAITLNDLFLFDLGKADLKPDAFPVLEKLASLFPLLDAKVSIEGHTDDLPVQPGSLFQDNWGLSQARSVSVIRYFVNSANLPPDMFISAAYADTRPVAPNDSEVNRQKNRRVEIVVLRDDKR
jgi:chemotaxis protein MotB